MQNIRIAEPTQNSSSLRMFVECFKQFTCAGGDTCPEFCKSMSFDKFIDLLKKRGVMEKDIEILKSKCYRHVLKLSTIFDEHVSLYVCLAFHM